MRDVLLERYGSLYANLNLAIAWTRSIEGEDAKRCGTGWDRTEPLTDPNFAAGFFKSRGQGKNPVVVLRNSGLIGIECDTVEGLEEIRSLNLPPTVTVQSSQPYKLHFWFRPDEGCTEFAAFRFESAGITADRGRYLLVPPAVHPSGSVYAFRPELSPDEQEIAVLPRDKYEEIVRKAGKTEVELRDRLSSDPAAKITEGLRRQTIFRMACSMQGFGAPHDAIHRAALEMNASRNEPPLSEFQVRAQVEGALVRYPAGTIEPWEIELEEGNDTDDDVVCLSTIKPRSVEWHYKPFVQVSAFHLLAGESGAGKGSWLAWLIASMTTGKTETLHNEPRNVIIISSEDSASIDLVPRIVAAGGILSRVFVLQRNVSFPRDLKYLERVISKERGGLPTGLVIIDPVANHLDSADTDGEGSVRAAINELNYVADRTNSAIIGVRHLTKYGDGSASSVLGSGAWVAIPRAVLMMKLDTEVPYEIGDRVLEVVNSNRGQIGARMLFGMDRVSVDGLDGAVPKLRAKTHGAWENAA